MVELPTLYDVERVGWQESVCSYFHSRPEHIKRVYCPELQKQDTEITGAVINYNTAVMEVKVFQENSYAVQKIT